MLPVLMFSAARAGVPVTPLNYRLSAAGLRELIDRLPQPLVVADAPYLDTVGRAGLGVVSSQVFLRDALTVDPVCIVADPDQVAVVLFTSGTTSRPKAVELTHANLTGYITQTVEFASSAADDAALICVPPYHIAGVSAVLSNLYAGRRMVYLPRFDADDWIRLVHDQNITNATWYPRCSTASSTRSRRDRNCCRACEHLLTGARGCRCRSCAGPCSYCPIRGSSTPTV